MELSMTKISDDKKRGRGRPSEGTEAVTIRLPKDVIQAVEEARILARPIPSRTDVIREAVEFWLKSKGLLK
jgi:hypothetical protein